MKRLLLIPIVFLLASCQQYNSRFEAKRACDNWVNKGGELKIIHYKDYWRDKKYYSKAFVLRYLPIRSCINETATSQILGLKIKGVKPGQFYPAYAEGLIDRTEADLELDSNKKVIKTFSY